MAIDKRQALSAALVVVFPIILSACASRMLNLSDKDFDPCRTECSAIDWAATTTCVDPNDASRELMSYGQALADALTGMDVPEDVCGCFTAVLSADGRLGDVEVVYSNWPGAADYLTSLFRDADSVGPPPLDGRCLVGVRAPGAFAN